MRGAIPVEAEATPSTPYLLDTGVLVRQADPSDARHHATQKTLAALAASGETLCITPQVLYEFWVVATRPVAVRGLGWTTARTTRQIGLFEQGFVLLPDSPGIYTEWKRIVTAYGVSGKPAHDARFVAAMKAQGVTHLLTFNAPDFARYAKAPPAGEGITIVDPLPRPATAPLHHA